MKAWETLVEDIKKVGIIIGHDAGASGGACRFRCPISDRFLVAIFSWGADWDHVSVRRLDGVCTWNEMCWVKDLFFLPEECVMQLHPPKSKYINVYPHVLHLWRPQKADVPQPPIVIV